MQVAHQQDHVTHAVIGGGAAIEFGISSSAEFFNILSSTLYKDQILAVVREVLCNAWDAHIEAGCTDVPVQVTLTDEKIVVRDFGKGIHRDDMGLIYGTYGNSTKKNDGQQTGGFGLGCKAPFAYTDHFEVISTNEGVRTIYNLSKSSAQAKGKPGIIPIASFPSTETGLQVTISLRNPGDRVRFATLVKRIASNGDMNLVINGLDVEPLGFDTSKSNYLLTRKVDMMDQPTDIMVRYGNVIYPVDAKGPVEKLYGMVRSHLAQMKSGYRHSSYKIIFQAPPHSISVTPSRESLSMQEHTIGTLNALFKEFMDSVKNEMPKYCEKFAVQVTEEAVKEARVKDLLSRKIALPGVVAESEAPLNLHDLPGMAERYMQEHYPSKVEFRKNDIKRRLTLMADANLLDRGRVQTYLRIMDKMQNPTVGNGGWLQRYYIGPLMKKLLAAGMDHERLYVYDNEDTSARHKNHLEEPIIPANNACPKTLYNALTYLRNIVVLSTSRLNIKSRIGGSNPVFKEFGSETGFLFYHISMKKNAKEIARAFFQKEGMEVIDLTNEAVAQTIPSSRRSSGAAPRAPSLKGWPSLKAIQASDGSIDRDALKGHITLRNEKPKFAVCVSMARDVPYNALGTWDSEATRIIIDLFGADGVVNTNKVKHEKALEAGAVQMDEYVVHQVCQEMVSNPRIHKYWAYDVDRVLDHYAGISNGYRKPVLRLIYNDASLCKKFKLVNTLTENEQKIVYLWKQMNSWFRTRHESVLAPVKAVLNAIPLHADNTAVVDKVKAPNPLLRILDEDQFKCIADSVRENKPQLAKLVKVMTILLDN